MSGYSYGELVMRSHRKAKVWRGVPRSSKFLLTTANVASNILHSVSFHAGSPEKEEDNRPLCFPFCSYLLQCPRGARNVTICSLTSLDETETCSATKFYFTYLNQFRQTVNSTKQQTATTVSTTQVTDGNTSTYRCFLLYSGSLASSSCSSRTVPRRIEHQTTSFRACNFAKCWLILKLIHKYYVNPRTSAEGPRDARGEVLRRNETVQRHPQGGSTLSSSQYCSDSQSSLNMIQRQTP